MLNLRRRSRVDSDNIYVADLRPMKDNTDYISEVVGPYTVSQPLRPRGPCVEDEWTVIALR